MNQALTFLLLSALALLGQVPLDESGREGTLEILVVDSFGKPVKGTAKISVQQLVEGKPTAVLRIGPRATLRYGTYRLTVQASPGYPVDKIIRIRSRYQIVVAPLFLAPIEAPWEGNTVRGRLPKGSIQKGCRYVRLISPLSETEFAENIALESGTFAFENVKPGKYIFVSIGDEGICDVIPTEVLPSREQELELR